jgi:6,7-dimethyl-8-ribityllumazine synthase
MIVIVQSLWNEAITSKLVDGARHVLEQNKMKYEVLQVPGALEIPLAIQWKREKLKNKLVGAIACGTVVKGDTYHFEVVANESARGLTEVSLRSGMPISNGILTCYNLNEALERAGGKMGNKGEEAALALIEMLKIKKRMGGKSR